MATQIQWRRGNTAQTAAFTGALAEITVDTEKKTLVVHDGVTVGGFPLSSGNASTNNTISISSAYNHTNSAFIQANAAFAAANAALLCCNTTNSAFGQANLAYDAANAANSLAQAAYNYANTVSGGGGSSSSDYFPTEPYGFVSQGMIALVSDDTFIQGEFVGPFYDCSDNPITPEGFYLEKDLGYLT